MIEGGSALYHYTLNLLLLYFLRQIIKTQGLFDGPEQTV